MRNLLETSPPGWKGTVSAMKKHKEIDNPFALAWFMKNKGEKSHYKNKDGKPEKKNETSCNCGCRACRNRKGLSFKEWLKEDVWTDKDNDHLGEPGNIQQMKQFLTTGLSAQDALGAQKNLGYRQELIRELAEKFGVDEKIAGQAVNAWIASTLGL